MPVFAGDKKSHMCIKEDEEHDDSNGHYWVMRSRFIN